MLMLMLLQIFFNHLGRHADHDLAIVKARERFPLSQSVSSILFLPNPTSYPPGNSNSDITC